jgi:hypothetical protein
MAVGWPGFGAKQAGQADSAAFPQPTGLTFNEVFI